MTTDYEVTSITCGCGITLKTQFDGISGTWAAHCLKCKTGYRIVQVSKGESTEVQCPGCEAWFVESEMICKTHPGCDNLHCPKCCHTILHDSLERAFLRRRRSTQLSKVTQSSDRTPAKDKETFEVI